MHTSPIYSRTQTRSSDRLPSNKRRNILRFSRKIVRKNIVDKICISIDVILYLRDRGTQTNTGKSTKMKNYILFIWKSIEKILFISWHLVRIFSKITCTAFCCIFSVESSSINTKVIFLNTWHFQPYLYQTFKCPASETFCSSYFQSYTMTSC